jgi:hypothetical protein
VWHHTQREGVTGVTRVSQKLERVEKWKRGPIVVGVPEPVFPPPLRPPRRQAHKKRLLTLAPHTSTCSIPGHSTVSAHGVERSMNAPAHRLAWNVLAYTHKSRLKNNFKLFLPTAEHSVINAIESQS